jgi:hypothetical protein
MDDLAPLNYPIHLNISVGGRDRAGTWREGAWRTTSTAFRRSIFTGNTLTFEASPKFVRLYLPSGACGNTVIRFFTNLQHYYDSLVRAEDGNGRPLFEF